MQLRLFYFRRELDDRLIPKRLHMLLLSYSSWRTCAGFDKERSMRNVHKKRARDKQNYLRNKESKRQASRNKYWKNPEKQRASSRAYSLTNYWKNPEKKRASSHTRYWEDPETKRASSHTRYWEDPETKRASSHTRYLEDPETKRASSHTRYWEDPETKRVSSHTRYWNNRTGRQSCIYHSALEQPLTHTCTYPIRQQLHPWFHCQVDKCKQLTSSRNPSTSTINYITSHFTWGVVTQQQQKNNRNKSQKSLPNANKHM